MTNHPSVVPDLIRDPAVFRTGWIPGQARLADTAVVL